MPAAGPAPAASKADGQAACSAHWELFLYRTKPHLNHPAFSRKTPQEALILLKRGDKCVFLKWYLTHKAFTVNGLHWFRNPCFINTEGEKPVFPSDLLHYKIARSHLKTTQWEKASERCTVPLLWQLITGHGPELFLPPKQRCYASLGTEPWSQHTPASQSFVFITLCICSTHWWRDDGALCTQYNKLHASAAASGERLRQRKLF